MVKQVLHFTESLLDVALMYSIRHSETEISCQSKCPSLDISEGKEWKVQWGRIRFTSGSAVSTVSVQYN